MPPKECDFIMTIPSTVKYNGTQLYKCSSMEGSDETAGILT